MRDCDRISSIGCNYERKNSLIPSPPLPSEYSTSAENLTGLRLVKVIMDSVLKLVSGKLTHADWYNLLMLQDINLGLEGREKLNDSKVEPVEFEGALSLEGPLLESLYAAYLTKAGHELVNAIETRGVQHDILEKTHDGFIFYECTGQELITVRKIDRFLNDIFKLDEVLREVHDKGLVKAVFVAAVTGDGWQENAKEVLEYVKNKVNEKIGCEVEVVSGLKLLKDLVSSGVLGIRLYQNKIYFTGPEDYGIRYDPQRKSFHLSTAPIDTKKFRETPYSFLPSHYWEQYYRELLREAMEGKSEEWSSEYSIFSYAFYEGLRLSRTELLTMLYKLYFDSLINRRVMNFGDSYLSVHGWSRKHDYFSIHIFSTDSKIDRNRAGEMRGKAIRVLDEVKRKEKIEKEQFSVYFHTLTEDWSSIAWSEVNEVPDRLKDEIHKIYVERGNDILATLLNAGVLGFRFKTKNQITLAGIGLNAVRIKDGAIEIWPGTSYGPT